MVIGEYELQVLIITDQIPFRKLINLLLYNTLSTVRDITPTTISDNPYALTVK